MEKKVTNLGTGGLNVDTPSHQLPPNVFSDGMNLRFTPENKIRGSHPIESAVPSITGSNNSKVIGVSYNDNASAQLLTYDFKTTGGFLTIGTTSVQAKADGIKLDYNESYKATLIEFNDVIVLNTGFNPPLYVSGNALVPFDNWNIDVNGVESYGPNAEGRFKQSDGANPNFVARRMKPWNNQLVFFNFVNTDNTLDPGDDIHDPIDLVISGLRGVNQRGTLSNQRFTVASTNIGSDDFILSGTAGRIIDGLELRESFMAYKSDSWVRIDRQVTQTGVFYNSQILTSDDGILTSDCVVEFENAMHFVVGNNGIYVHNGSEERQNVSKGIMEDDFYENIQNSNKTFVHKWTQEKEIWICYDDKRVTGTYAGTTETATTNANGCNSAWCWNYELKTWYKRTLPGLFDILETNVNSVTTTYAVNNTSDIKEMKLDAYETGSFLAKSNADMGDASMTKKIIRLFPQADTGASSDLLIDVQGHQNVNDTNIEFTAIGRGFNPNNDYKIDLRETGRYIDLKVSGSDPQLSALGVEVLPGSRR